MVNYPTNLSFIYANLALRSHNICFFLTVNIEKTSFGGVEMVAPPFPKNLTYGDVHGGTNSTLICANGASRSDNLCPLPSANIKKTSLWADKEMVSPKTELRSSKWKYKFKLN